MDKYDNLILDIIQKHREESIDKNRIGLRQLEKIYWKELESDGDLSIGQGKVGERITKLYLNGMIENKKGYGLTRKGKVHLQVSEIEI
jgi:hypothetical protein